MMNLIHCIPVLLWLLARTEAVEDIANHTETELLKGVFENYNKLARPVADHNSVKYVSMDLFLVKILDVDEIKQVFATSVNLNFYWFDELLTWKLKNYGNLHYTVLPYDVAWTPDILCLNAAETPGDIGQMDTRLMLFYTGSMTWWLKAILKTECEIRIKKYPFDTQHCWIVFSKFMNDDVKVMLLNNSESVLMTHYKEIAEWTVIDHYITSDSINLGAGGAFRYTNIVYHVVIRRRCQLCIINIILPVGFLALLNLFTFFVPSDRGEKVSFPGSVFLSLAVFLTIITLQLPESIDGPAYLSIFVTFQLGLSALTLLLAVFSLYVQSSVCSATQPTCLMRLVYAVRCSRKSKVVNCYNVENQDDKPSTEMNEADGNFISETYIGNEPSTDKHMSPNEIMRTVDMFLFVIILTIQTTGTLVFISVMNAEN